MTAHDPIRIEVTMTAPADAAWHALREPAEISRWFGWDYPGLSAEIEMIFVKDVVASEAEHTITLGDGEWFAVEAHGDRTVVRVTRPAPADGSGWQDIYDDVTEGWLTFLQQMGFALERHRGEDRQTMFLAGEPRAGTLDAFGFQRLAAGAGERYELTLPFGAAIAGTVWYRSEFQVGLTVDGYGDGLLIATFKPADAHPPHGMALLNLTAYGRSDAEFSAVREQWLAGWTEHYTDARAAFESMSAADG